MVSQIKEFYFLIILEKWLSIYYVNKELNTIKTFTSQSSTLNLFQKTNKAVTVKLSLFETMLIRTKNWQRMGDIN